MSLPKNDCQRFCKGCEKDVTDTMYCECGCIPLNKESTYTKKELEEREKDIEEFERLNNIP